MSWWNDFDIWLENFLLNFIPDPETDPKTLPMNQHQEPIQPPIVIAPPAPPKYFWDTPTDCRHSVRVICDEEGLTVEEKNLLSATLHCESNYNPQCVHPNVVNGKVTSTDYGICQINDYYHIGLGKDFPSADYVLHNPEACVRWMCKQWKAGLGRLWICYSKGLYQQYSS